jgi:hypothetical protein
MKCKFTRNTSAARFQGNSLLRGRLINMKKILVSTLAILILASVAPACGYTETCPIDGENASFDGNKHFEDGREFREYRHTHNAYGPNAVVHTFMVECK